MHYLDVGEGPPVLMVHGNPTWSFYWRNLVKGLSADHRCIVPDHVGCGLSDKPPGFHRLEDRIAHLSHLVETLDLRDVTLVVHDWGGPIGLGMAVRHPERIRRLVLLNTAVFEGSLPLSIRMCRWPGVGPALILGLNGFLRVALLRAVADRTRIGGPVARGYLTPHRSWADREAILHFVQDIPLEQEHPTRQLFLDIDAGLTALEDCPVLLIWGEKDFCFTPEFRRGWEERLPRAEVHALADVGHWVMEDAHERVVPLVRDFLARHPLPLETAP
ncbi:MAG: alpha/beta fold hydrolase [Deltaproteobacteria bacterium]|nr:alpha/beta fold hydrolase [Deltaproteobacteria bacterium]